MGSESSLSSPTLEPVRPWLSEQLDDQPCAFEGDGVVLEAVRPTAESHGQPVPLGGPFEAAAPEIRAGHCETGFGPFSNELPGVGEGMGNADAEAPSPASARVRLRTQPRACPRRPFGSCPRPPGRSSRRGKVAPQRRPGGKRGLSLPSWHSGPGSARCPAPRPGGPSLPGHAPPDPRPSRFPRPVGQEEGPGPETPRGSASTRRGPACGPSAPSCAPPSPNRSPIDAPSY